MTTIQLCLQEAHQELEKLSDSAKLDAELLLCHVLQKPRSYLYSRPEQTLTLDQLKPFKNLVNSRAQGQPISYLLGEREFWSLTLRVNKKVLIPRPETELLVETALELLPVHNALIADLGTGSGAIALALASEKPDWQIYATDASKAALKVAIHNAQRLNINTIQFRYGSWCEALPSHKFDAIISNPPYIAINDPHLKQGDLRFEPQTALVANKNGLEDIETIINHAQTYLKAHAPLLIEHGYKQGKAVRALFLEADYHNVRTIQDLSGMDRITLGFAKP